MRCLLFSTQWTRCLRSERQRWDPGKRIIQMKSGHCVQEEQREEGIPFREGGGRRAGGSFRWAGARWASLGLRGPDTLGPDCVSTARPGAGCHSSDRTGTLSLGPSGWQVWTPVADRRPLLGSEAQGPGPSVLPLQGRQHIPAFHVSSRPHRRPHLLCITTSPWPSGVHTPRGGPGRVCVAAVFNVAPRPLVSQTCCRPAV